MSNKSAYSFLTRVKEELQVKILPRNFKKVLQKKLNRYMKRVKVERVKFKVKHVFSSSQIFLMSSLSPKSKFPSPEGFQFKKIKAQSPDFRTRQRGSFLIMSRNPSPS